MTAPRFVSVSATAETLGVSDNLIYELVQRGELPSVRLGRRVMVPAIAIDALVERTMAGFDPDRLLASLAAAAPSLDTRSAVASPGEGTGTTGLPAPIPLRR